MSIACKNIAIFLHAQFTRGIYDDSIGEQLLLLDLCTFDDIAKKSIVLEVSRIDNCELLKNSNIKTYMNLVQVK